MKLLAGISPPAAGRRRMAARRGAGAAGWPLIAAYSGYGAVAARFLSRSVGAVYALYTLRRAVASTAGPSELNPTETTGLDAMGG